MDWKLEYQTWLAREIRQYAQHPDYHIDIEKIMDLAYKAGVSEEQVGRDIKYLLNNMPLQWSYPQG